MTTLLTHSTDLAAFADRAMAAQRLALDTEFVRERTYYPELCLIQAELPDEILLIDALAELDWSLFEPVLRGGPTKILHACRQDIEVLKARWPEPLAPLFDTQVAAALCGHPPQWSYGALVQELTGVELVKGSARTDWSRRPLSDTQLVYAADDVRYLPALMDALSERLEALGRRAWFDEEMTALSELSMVVAPEDAWTRVKGHARLPDEARAALQALAAWREQRAMRRNRPRRWIASDEALLALAQARPRDRAGLQAIAELPPALRERCGEEILATLREAETQPPPALTTGIPDPAALKALQKRLRELAASLAIDPSMLATRSDLTELLLSGHAARLEQGWRAEVVLPALREVLA